MKNQQWIKGRQALNPKTKWRVASFVDEAGAKGSLLVAQKCSSWLAVGSFGCGTLTYRLVRLELEGCYKTCRIGAFSSWRLLWILLLVFRCMLGKRPSFISQWAWLCRLAPLRGTSALLRRHVRSVSQCRRLWNQGCWPQWHRLSFWGR